MPSRSDMPWTPRSAPARWPTARRRPHRPSKRCGFSVPSTIHRPLPRRRDRDGQTGNHLAASGDNGRLSCLLLLCTSQRKHLRHRSGPCWRGTSLPGRVGVFLGHSPKKLCASARVGWPRATPLRTRLNPTGTMTIRARATVSCACSMRAPLVPQSLQRPCAQLPKVALRGPDRRF